MKCFLLATAGCNVSQCAEYDDSTSVTRTDDSRVFKFILRQGTSAPGLLQFVSPTSGLVSSVVLSMKFVGRNLWDGRLNLKKCLRPHEKVDDQNEKERNRDFSKPAFVVSEP